MTRCYLGLGSNLRAPKRQLRQAIHGLCKLPRTVVSHRSSLYVSHPCGVRSQPQYYNMVIALDTSLPPQQLLTRCLALENKQKRLRKKRWGPRTLDIDLLLYGSQKIDNHRLTLPHPRMLERDFVLVPLLEISKEAQLPNGKPLISFLETCKKFVVLQKNFL